jgi:hypothetical protein
VPLEPGKNREQGAPEYLGEFLDGLGNKINMLAVANPSPERNHDLLTTRAAGFGIVKFNKKTREITIECWPRNADITARLPRARLPRARLPRARLPRGLSVGQAPISEQYPGWPRTIEQEDNYGRKAVAYLPTIEIKGMTNPVVQVIDESNDEIVYTLRINGTSYRPKVFKKGEYTIKVGQQGTDRMKTLTGVRSLASDKTEEIEVRF